MVIPNENFKDDLRYKFIELLDSGRGVQTKLAKAINKPASYFSEIKRGNPVNALHLKAVGVVFGSDKVVELLGIDNKPVSDLESKTKDKNASNNVTKVVIEHQDLVRRFKNPKRAKEINERLIKIEEVSEELYDKADIYIRGLYDAAEVIDDSKKTPKTGENLQGKSTA